MVKVLPENSNPGNNASQLSGIFEINGLDCGITTDNPQTATLKPGTSSDMALDFGIRCLPHSGEISDKTVECDGNGNQDDWTDFIAQFTVEDPNLEMTVSQNETLGCGLTKIVEVTGITTGSVFGNDTVSAIFTIVDTSAPDLIEEAKNETVECDGSGNNETLQAWLSNNGGAVAEDMCGGVTWSNDFTGLTDGCGETGNATVIFTATDDCGNSVSTTATFTIEDTTTPVLNCKALSIYLDENGSYELNENDIKILAGTVTDNCTSTEDIDVQVSTHTFGCAQDGSGNGISVTVTATDLCGNVATCNTVVSVIDTIAPLAICQDLVIQLDESGTASITVDDLNNGSFDNCAIDTLFIDKENFNCANVGENEVVLTVIDISGNVGTCTATVTVEQGSYDCGNSEINAAPDFLSIAYCEGETAGGSLNLLTNDSGFLADGITLSVSNLPENVEVNTTDGTMTYTNSNPSEMTITFTYTICHIVNSENCSQAEVTIRLIKDSDCDGVG